MGISWNSRALADARLISVHGGRMAGGYILRLGVEFHTLNWDVDAYPPQVLMSPARVWLNGQNGLSLGLAYPETLQPFTVSAYAGKRAILFDLMLSRQAMEAIESHRNGQGVVVAVRLQAEARKGSEVQIVYDDLVANFNLSQWTEAMSQAGYGRSILFEVPIPSEPATLGGSIELLEAARQFLAQGNYSEVVAKCRMVLERLTDELGEGLALKQAREINKQDRTLLQRELIMRQEAINFAHLAHHPTGSSLGQLFNRNAAQMLLATTAALVSSAMSRNTYLS